MIWFLSPKVKRVLQEESISQEELAHMLRHAAISRVLQGSNAPAFNRRYHRWVFHIEDGVVRDMRHAERVVVGVGFTRVFEEHESCNGEGCRECGWVGSICRLVTDDVHESLVRAKAVS
jgi:hypothetical protein